MRPIKRQGVAIDKLAQKLANQKSKAPTYETGNPAEKVWINFQSTKQQKRDFNKVCKDNNINASAFLRTCLTLLIKNEGDVRKTLNIVKPNDVVALDNKANSETEDDNVK